MAQQVLLALPELRVQQEVLAQQVIPESLEQPEHLEPLEQAAQRAVLALQELPESLERVTLARLRSIRPRTEVPFATFADGLIEATGLTWTAPDMRYARMLLHGAVERMVIGILEDFGAVKCTYRDSPVLDGFKDLDAFEITPLGAALLDSLVIQEG